MSTPLVRHVLITGAAGAGTTTLAQALAEAMGITHLEADDFLWLPSDPPYQHMADKTQRGERLLQAMQARGRTVVAGSILGWNDRLEQAFDLVVFLYLPARLRLERLARRETQRFGQADPAFLAWAAQYDEGDAPGRSLARHQAWLSTRRCSCLRLEGDMTVAERLEQVVKVIGEADPRVFVLHEQDQVTSGKG